MAELLTNGRTLRKGDPLLADLLARKAAYKARGVPYPQRRVDDIPPLPHVWWGHVPYDARTLARLVPTAAAKRRPVALPDHFLLDGEGRLPGERKDQHTKYLAFRDLGPARSLNQLAKALGKRAYNRNGDAFTDGHLSAMAHRFRWHERAAAWDGRMAVEARRTAQAVLQEQMQEEVARRRTYLDNEWETIERAMEAVLQMLAYPVVEQVSATVGANGAPMLTVWKPGKWTYASLARLIDALAKVGRVHVGLTAAIAAMDQSEAPGRQEKPELSDEEEQMHRYANQQAEDAYFAAIEGWPKGRRRPAEEPPAAGSPALRGRGGPGTADWHTRRRVPSSPPRRGSDLRAGPPATTPLPPR